MIYGNRLFCCDFTYCYCIDCRFVTYFQQAERKIPIQYTKQVVGAPTSSYLPLKVNAAGLSQLSLPAHSLRHQMRCYKHWLASIARKAGTMF